MALQEAEEMGPEETEVVTDFSARLIEKLAKDNKNKSRGCWEEEGKGRKGRVGRFYFGREDLG